MLLLLKVMIAPSQASEDAKRLLKDLLRGYNKIVRPVRNTEDKVELFLGIKLSQIADIVNIYFTYITNKSNLLKKI